MKKSLKALREADPAQEDFISAIADKTENFTNITKGACEKLIEKVAEMIDSAADEDGEE